MFSSDSTLGNRTPYGCNSTFRDARCYLNQKASIKIGRISRLPPRFAEVRLIRNLLVWGLIKTKCNSTPGSCVSQSP